MTITSSLPRVRLLLIIAAVVILALTSVASAAALTLSPRQTVSSNASDEWVSDLNGSRIVWIRVAGDTEVFYDNIADSAAPLQITNDAVNDNLARISGNIVVWQRNDGDNEIGLRDVTGPSNLLVTSNSVEDSPPRISGNRVVWESYVGGDPEIYFLDYGKTGIWSLTNNEWWDRFPAIDGDRVVWDSWGPSAGWINLWDRSNLQVSTLGGNAWSASGSSAPQISGRTVLWGSSSPYGPHAYIKTIGGGLRTFAMSGDDEVLPIGVSGSIVAWWGRYAPGMDSYFDLWVYDTARSLPPMRIATDIHLFGSVPPFAEVSSSYVGFVNGAGKLCVWDKSSRQVTQLLSPTTEIRDVQLSGSRLAWDDGPGPNGDIYTAYLVRTKASLTRPTGPKSISRRKWFTAAGYLKPKHAAGLKPVQIRCYRKQSGKWKLRKTYYAKTSNYSSYSKYSARVKLPYAGKWRIRAYYPTSASNLAAVSSYRYITAK